MTYSTTNKHSLLNKGFLIVSLLLVCFVWCAITNNAIAQTFVKKDTLAKGKRLEIISSKRYNIQKGDSSNQFISLAGNVIVQQERTTFYADSAVLNQKENTLEAFGNIHINDADSIHTYSQYLKYIGKERKAYLKKSVKLTDGKGVLTTEELEYDVALKIGTYLNGGKVVNGKTVLTSKEGYYYGDTRDVYFKKNVVLIDPQQKVTTDTLLYNTGTDQTTIVSPTTIYNGKRVVKTSEGKYNAKAKKAIFTKRTTIDDSTYTFTADQMAFDDSTGQGHYRGNAVYRSKDTINGFDLIANDIKTNSKNNSLLATEHPLLIIKQRRDSVFVRADTLYTARLTDLVKTRTIPPIRARDTAIKEITLDSLVKKDSSKNTFFEAYYHVRIYHDSMQAVCDSMFYSAADTAFRLFKDPIVWAQKNQVTGDTIYVFTQNKKPERVQVFENALMISKEGEAYYNQVKGTSINAYFIDGNMNHVHTKGSPAESVYYAVDDNGKFIGVNKATSDVIDSYFRDKKPQRVVFRNKLEGTTYPMGQVNHDELRLRGFKWQEDRRPKSKFEILVD